MTLSGTSELLAAVLVGVIAAALGGCEKADDPKGKLASAGAVRIVALSPETTTPLKVGEKVKIQVEVSYRLAAESGVVALVVQADNAGVAQSRQLVKRGRGKATLSVELVVPETKALQVFTPLQAQGQKTTTTADARTYKVVGK
jgi:hypothetical protein